MVTLYKANPALTTQEVDLCLVHLSHGERALVDVVDVFERWEPLRKKSSPFSAAQKLKKISMVEKIQDIKPRHLVSVL